MSLMSFCRLQLCIVQRICDILAKDSEGFPRRSAAKALLNLIKIHSKVRPLSDTYLASVAGVLVATGDQDWEVKCTVVDAIGAIIYGTLQLVCGEEDVQVPEYARDLVDRNSENDNCRKLKLQTLERFVEMGVVKALFLSLNDYEQKVCEKASVVFQTLKHFVKDVSEMENESVGNFLNSTLDALERITKFDIETPEQQFVDDVSRLDSIIEDIMASVAHGGGEDEDNAVDCY